MTLDYAYNGKTTHPTATMTMYGARDESWYVNFYFYVLYLLTFHRIVYNSPSPSHHYEKA